MIIWGILPALVGIGFLAAQHPGNILPALLLSWPIWLLTMRTIDLCNQVRKEIKEKLRRRKK